MKMTSFYLLITLAMCCIAQTFSDDLTIETLLVADKTMVDYYGENLSSHLLDIFNEVQTKYHLPSLEKSFNIALVKLIILNEDKPTFPLSTLNDMSEIYNGFMKWSKTQSPRHNYAILVTRKQYNGRSDFGMTMCSSDGSVALVKDSGYGTASDMAKAIGISMVFGDDQSSRDYVCQANSGMGSIMGAPGNEDSKRIGKGIFWSKCSKSSAEKRYGSLNDRPFVKCLKVDNPVDVSPIYSDLPGQRGTPFHVCRDACGKDFEPYMEKRIHGPEICQSLHCVKRNSTNDVIERCMYKASPFIGSTCEENGHCVEGKCVKNDVWKHSCPATRCNNARWIIGKWSKCCGNDYKQRTVKCMVGSKTLSDDECIKTVPKPAETTECLPGEVGFCIEKDVPGQIFDGCPDGWVKKDDWCYRGYQKPGGVDQPFAKLECSAQNAHLAVIDSQAANDVLQSMINEASPTRNGAYIGVIWDDYGTYPWGTTQWVTGERLGDPKRPFSNFGTVSENPNIMDWHSFKCAGMLATSGKWFATTCDKKFDYVICSKLAQ